MQLDDYDLNLIRERLLAHFTVERLDEQGLLDRAPDAELRAWLGELDVEFFCRFYLREHFFKPPAAMHRTIFASIKPFIEGEGRDAAVWVLPRGFAKTTMGCLGIPAWCVAYKKRRHIPIISDSFDQAKDQLRTLGDELTNNPRLLGDFGKLHGEGVWQAAEIETTNGVKVRALGSGMKIRGRKYGRYRPDLIILDDIENLKGVNLPHAREQLKGWLERSVMRAGWENTKVLALGNFLHYECLLATLADNPMFTARIFRALEEWPENMELWDEWRGMLVNLEDPDKEKTAEAFYKKHEEEMLKGAETAWPEAFPVYDLMMMRVSDGDASFNMELQNHPHDPSKALFQSYGKFRREMRDKVEWLVPLSGRPEVRLKDCAIFGFTDPSLGKTTRSDFSAIVILAKAPTRQLFCLEADIKRRPVDMIIKAQIKWAQKYAITRWGIENTQFQALFASDSANRSMEEGVYLPVTPVPHIRNKAARIQSLQPDLENRYILLPEHGQELFKKQLEHYPSGHDDGPDALEGARTIARQWEPIGAEEVVEGEIHQFGQPKRYRGSRQVERDPYAEADDFADQTIREYKESIGVYIPDKEEIFTPVTML